MVYCSQEIADGSVITLTYRRDHKDCSKKENNSDLYNTNATEGKCFRQEEDELYYICVKRQLSSYLKKKKNS